MWFLPTSLPFFLSPSTLKASLHFLENVVFCTSGNILFSLPGCFSSFNDQLRWLFFRSPSLTIIFKYSPAHRPFTVSSLHPVYFIAPMCACWLTCLPTISSTTSTEMVLALFPNMNLIPHTVPGTEQAHNKQAHLSNSLYPSKKRDFLTCVFPPLTI